MNEPANMIRAAASGTFSKLKRDLETAVSVLQLVLLCSVLADVCQGSKAQPLPKKSPVPRGC